MFTTPGVSSRTWERSGQELLAIQIKKFGFDVKYVGLDAGYYTAHLCKSICNRDIQPVIATRLGPHEKDVYACPNDCFLSYRTTRQGYSEYISNEYNCRSCPKRSKCFIVQNKISTIRRHVWEEFKEVDKFFLRTEKRKYIYGKRKETVE